MIQKKLTITIYSPTMDDPKPTPLYVAGLLKKVSAHLLHHSNIFPEPIDFQIEYSEEEGDNSLIDPERTIDFSSTTDPAASGTLVQQALKPENEIEVFDNSECASECHYPDVWRYRFQPRSQIITGKQVYIDKVQTGLLLKALIDQSCLRVRDIQDVLGLECPQSIYRWFNGAALPTVEHFYILHQILSCHMEDLLLTTSENPEAQKK